MDQSLQHMQNTWKYLPQFMKQNLKNMPNNKGYIYKGIWFFGELEPVSNTRTMFEKQDNILIIYKITARYIIISEKNLATKQTRFVEKIKRKAIFK